MTEDAPRRGPGLGTIVAIIVSVLVALVLGLIAGPPLKSWLETRAETAAAGDGSWYISQMHPWIIQPEPGQCPICGMDLTPVDPERFAGEIAIDPVVVQNMGVRIAPADIGPIVGEAEALGVITWNAETLHDITLRAEAWIEGAHVHSQWNRVEAGDLLARVYMPAALAAQQEWLVADRSEQPVLVQAARERLLGLGASAAWIDGIAERGITRTMPIRAPVGGVVAEVHLHDGMYMPAGSRLARIAETGTVWLEAELYERQLAGVRPGMPVTVSFTVDRPAVDGVIDAVMPELDPRTRTLRVRVVLPNPEGDLRPGMYARAALQIPLAESVVRVPREAVVGTGERRVVFISLGRGRFEPRPVELGPQGSDGLVAVRSGVEAGEQVVVSGQFLLDSESRMRSALAAYMRGDLAVDQAPAAPPAAAAVEDAPAAVQTALATTVEHALSVHAELYQGGDAAVQLAALQAALAELVAAARAADEHAHHRLPALEELAELAQAEVPAGLAEQRIAFGELTVPLDAVIKAYGLPPELADVVGMRCGMARGVREKGVWIQRGTAVRNPFYGADAGMSDCAADTWALPERTAGAAP